MSLTISCLSLFQKEDCLSGGDLPAWTATSDAGVTRPLTLDEREREPAGFRRTCRCLLHSQCGRTFDLPGGEEDLLEHLMLAHRVLISEPNKVSDLSAYLDYWRNKMESGNAAIGEFCSTVQASVVMAKKGKRKVGAGAKQQEGAKEAAAEPGKEAEEESFYMLSDVLVKSPR